MQEQNSEKVVSLSVRTTKVTANVLKSAVRAYLSAQKNKSPKVYKGKQSVKHLIQKGEKLTNIEVTDQNINPSTRPPVSTVSTTLSKRTAQKSSRDTSSFSRQRTQRL